jgi:hypothetical protein
MNSPPDPSLQFSDISDVGFSISDVDYIWGKPLRPLRHLCGLCG